MADQPGIDRDIALQRTSQRALADVQRFLARLTSESPNNISESSLYHIVDKTKQSLDVFQEDPQLLDPVLNSILTPLLDRYLAILESTAYQDPESPSSRYAQGLSTIICSFCKVRGRKVISRFLSNEPRHLHVLFAALHQVQTRSRQDWEEHFVVLLWLSHLILTPFDLQTFSSTCRDAVQVAGLALPPHLPLIAVDAVKAALSSMDSATSRQTVSASLLTRLVLRPDMQKLGLLDLTVPWAISRLKAINDAGQIHRAISLLMLVNGIVLSGSLQEIGMHAVGIYEAIGAMFIGDDEQHAVLRASATAKRFAIKTLRNVVIQALQSRNGTSKAAASDAEQLLETRGALEEVIDYLLTSLADRDTQVRMAASKALALFALKLDPDMAQEIVDAVIGALNEDVLDNSGGRSLEAVNPVRWHGLTLALSHMLFRRTPSSAQIPAILDALFLALAFEQKSSSGVSIGGNVRDAANYGLWSLARRYTTEELAGAKNIEPKISSLTSGSIVQQTADRLVLTACVDPIGNVRRGSSAALQELIGRHPDMVASGISLVQAVDYLAVGLRTRAMTEVAAHAAQLHRRYRDCLFEGLLGWRGLLALDQVSRISAAEAVGRLSAMQPRTHQQYLDRLRSNTVKLEAGIQPERLEGLWLAQAAVLRQYCELTDVPLDFPNDIAKTAKLVDDEWTAIQPLALQAFGSLTDKRAAFVAHGYLSLLQARASFFMSDFDSDGPISSTPSSSTNEEVVVHALCKIDGESPVLDNIFDAFSMPTSQSQLSMLQSMLKSKAMATLRIDTVPGVLRALGQLFFEVRANVQNELQLEQSDAIQAIDLALGPKASIEARIVGLQTLGSVASPPHGELIAAREPKLWREILNLVAERAHPALNDYTVTDKGDVGSLLRSQALKSLVMPICSSLPDVAAVGFDCFTSALRISVEKLDKPRLDAVAALMAAGRAQDALPCMPFQTQTQSVADVSSYEHFYAVACILLRQPRDQSEDQLASINNAIVEGFASSAGSASSNVLTVAREAFLDVADMLPVGPPTQEDQPMMSLYGLGNIFVEVLGANLGNERVATSMLEFLAFMLEAGTFQRLAALSGQASQKPKFRTLLSLVQKAHFKSMAMPKLLAAVAVYRGLAEVPELTPEVLKKLVSMLAHPFPAVRLAVGETLWTVTGNEELLERDWRGPVDKNKTFVGRLKSSISAA